MRERFDSLKLPASIVVTPERLALFEATRRDVPRYQIRHDPVNDSDELRGANPQRGAIPS